MTRTVRFGGLRPVTPAPVRLGGGIGASPFPQIVGIGTAEALEALDQALADCNRKRIADQQEGQ